MAGWLGGEIPVSHPDSPRAPPALAVSAAGVLCLLLRSGCRCQSLFGLRLLTPALLPLAFLPENSSQRPETAGKPGARAGLGQD